MLELPRANTARGPQRHTNCDETLTPFLAANEGMKVRSCVYAIVAIKTTGVDLSVRGCVFFYYNVVNGQANDSAVCPLANLFGYDDVSFCSQPFDRKLARKTSTKRILLRPEAP